MTDFVDLHCHYLPAVDDGVRTQQDGIELCRALSRLGFTQVAATPHIRSGMFPNQKADLVQRFELFAAQTANLPGMPSLLLGAEHFCDDVFWGLFEKGDTIPYSDTKAMLIELPPDNIPLGLADGCFRMQVRGIRPVLAHPERYPTLFDSTAPIERLLEMGVLGLLDLMSLTGKYGRKPRRTAERMLEEGVYYAACSDSHKPADVDVVATGIERLRELCGTQDAHLLLSENPARILRGDVDR